jgi:hypothetical protein
MKRFGIFLIMLVLILGTAMAACSINVNDFELNLRSDGSSYYSNISAEDGDEIDIRIEFEVVDITDIDDCADNLTAKATIFRWDEDNDEWDAWRSTTSKNQTLDEDTYTFTWSNDFSINDNYERYKIEGFVNEGTDQLEIDDAYIDIENNSCSGIELITSDFEMNEDTSKTRTFRIENNTDADFDVDRAEVSFSTALITSGSVDYPSTVRDNTSGNVTIELDAGFVSYDRTATGRFSVSGDLDGTHCSVSSIGEETFDVTVNDTGSGGNGGTGTSSNCEDISLHVRDFVMNEGREVQEIFYLENDTTKRFELTDVDVTENGLELEAFYYEKYAFPGNIADIILKAKSGNIVSDKTYDNTIKVKGRFSDGKTCSFDDVQNDFETKVIDTTSSYTNCDGFNISAPEKVSIASYGNIPITITNNTNGRADILVEGVQASPTIISLPAQSALSRDISVVIHKANGEIILKPTVVGCNAETKRIEVENIAEGILATVTMNLRIVRDENRNVLSIEFTNQTNKLFVGVLSVDAENEVINDRVITIPTGTSFAEVELPRSVIRGKVTFVSGEEAIEKEFGEDGSVFAGLFALGGITTTIGLILLVVVIIIAVAIVLTDYNRRTKEIWEIQEQ